MAATHSAFPRAFASLLILAAPLCARPQFSSPIPDPANLTGEHISPPALADTLPINHGAPALEQLLRKLRTRASMMLIVAHPDDEDGGFLTLESRGAGARVAMLTLTRGEGGQNLMSADFDDALGLIRTQELLAADRYMGVDQFFGTEVDFGFSKTKEESFKKWTHDRVLYDAVRCVRLYRPLVLASVFVGGVTDGHGHHQVAGEIAQEVFLAAADPKVFPEMGLPPWAPLKVYARVPFARVTAQGMYDYATGKWAPPVFHNYVTGADITHEPVATVTIHEGDKPDIPAFEGQSFIQFARHGLALQKTQIGANNLRLAPSGDFNIGYTLMATRIGCPMLTREMSGAKAAGDHGNTPFCARASATTEQSIFDGIDTSLPSLADLAPSASATLRATLTTIDGDLAEAQRIYNPANPELNAPPLREALRTLDTLIASTKTTPENFDLLHELRIKRAQLNNALCLAIGITFQPMIESRVDSPSPGDLVRGHPVYIEHFTKSLPETDVNPLGTTIEADPTVFGTGLFERAHMTTVVPVSDNAPVTRPYFSRDSLQKPFYAVTDPSLRNAPSTPAPIVVIQRWQTESQAIELRGILATDHHGNHNAANITPEVSVRVTPSQGILSISPSGKTEFSVKVQCTSSLANVRGTVRLELPNGWRSEPLQAPFAISGLSRDGLSFIVFPSKLDPKQLYRITAVAESGGKHYRESFRPVGYPGLTYTNLYTPATYRATAVDVTTAPDLHIAYLPGTGDDVPSFLPNLGVTPTLISTKDLSAGSLKRFDAVILGVRALAAHPELSGKGSEPLNRFAAGGGVVIVQYNSSGDASGTAPFPFNVPGDHSHDVVVEEQPVTLLEPDAPLLSWPNKITSADFSNWVAERGHGFASTWDPHFTPLLETHDPDQDPQRGGLLVAPVGKGAYIYCALALYRQLPEGVPGAYRLMANLLSYSKNPHRN